MKPKVAMGLCYPSGSGGMFLTELIYPTTDDKSGKYETNPGCNRSVSHNEYGGAQECVFVDNTDGPLEVNEKSILVAKLNIHNYLPFYDCPITYQIDVQDDESYAFTQELFFLKKYLGGYPQYEEKFKDVFQESGLSELLSEFKSIHPYSKIATDLYRMYLEVGQINRDMVLSQCRTIYSEYLDRGQKSRYNKKERWDRDTNIDRSALYDPEEIKKHTHLEVVSYADLFLNGKQTWTIWDSYLEEIGEYTERNWKLIEQFEDEFL